MTTRSCWGCGTSLCPPKLPSGADAPRFKCTWCLAVNEPAFVFPNRRRSRRARMKTRWRQLEVVFARWGGRALAVAVVLTTLSVAWAQIAHLAPAVAGDSRVAEGGIVAVTLFFLCNVFFNLVLGSARRAGVVEATPRPAAFREASRSRRSSSAGHAIADALADALADAPGSDARRIWRGDGGDSNASFGVPRGAFASRVPRAARRAAKPPGAHHCSTCRRCVRAMDHRCPFVANGVGADTTRHFLSFVGYVAVGVLFGLGSRAATAEAGADPLRFVAALGSKRQFDRGWRNASEETVGGDGALFGSRRLARLLGPPPVTAKALSPRSALSRVARAASRATRGSSRVVAAAFDEAPDWVGWWAWQLCVGGMICVATGLLFWSTLRGVAAGETYVESLARKTGGARGKETRDGTGRDASGSGLARRARGAVRSGIERGCPRMYDCFEAVTCGCVSGSAGPVPWSRVGAFHLRQVFGSGPVAWLGAPLTNPPVGARNGAGTGKKGT